MGGVLVELTTGAPVPEVMTPTPPELVLAPVPLGTLVTFPPMELPPPVPLRSSSLSSELQARNNPALRQDTARME
jgi:hypothetical protein